MKRTIAALAPLALLAGCAALVGHGTMPDAISPNAAAASAAVGAPVVDGCRMFPTPPPSGPTGNDWWNTDVSKYPLDPRSAAYMRGLTGNLHPDFGHNPNWGIPITVVPRNQKRVPMTFGYSSSSDPGPYPIPPNAQIEGGAHSSGDRHVLVLQKGTCTLYELWNAHPRKGGKSWYAGAGAVFVLSSNTLRPNGWTSADAAGLPITPALVKCSEVAAGAIHHALRVTFDKTQKGYIHPATHDASDSTDANLPPMGLRLRLKASYDISHFNRVSQIILTAMKRYGLLVADNGSNWYFQGEGGTAASCWNNAQLDQLKAVPGTAFEVVKTGTILR